MAFDEYIRRAILTGRTYDDLPARVKAILPPNEWRAKVREFCIQRGYPWSTSAARHVCGQQEYYDDLMAKYRAWGRIFPYHLAEYVSRVQRSTPFKYYREVLFLTLKDEKPYDTMPNFTAADALRVLGVGRNEYISIMNACKAKKLMWRVNRAIARDMLPQAEQEVRLEPWWLVQVTNVGETEFRELSPAEADLLRAACDADNAPPQVSKFDEAMLRRLQRQGLIYFEVPVAPTDRFTIPPLEGFVSNRTADASDSGSDPVEALLYSAFVAGSERLTVAELAGILGVAVEELQVAMSVACRLGFATRLPPAAGEPAPGPLSPFQPHASSATPATPRVSRPRLPPAAGASGVALAIPEDEEAGGGPWGAAGGPAAAPGVPQTPRGAIGRAGSAGGSGAWDGSAAVAVVVDSEATGYLMMGALSPGLKRHSVTLFEAGRVSGSEVMAELIQELWASYQAGQGFEGDMLRLTNYTAALATLLEAARGSGGATQLELVRKESLAGLDPVAAAKVLAHSYCAVLPIAPLPGPPLPLSPFRPGPTHYGPTAEAASPWLHLALYAASRSGPVSLVLAAGQRLWRLPPQLEHCSHALLWSWDPEPRAGLDSQPLLVEGTFLLATLNELLTRSALMAQPLLFSRPFVAAGPATHQARHSSGGGGGGGGGNDAHAAALQLPVDVVEFADVALPLIESGSTPQSSRGGASGGSSDAGLRASEGSAGSSSAARLQDHSQQQKQQQQAGSAAGTDFGLHAPAGSILIQAVHRRSGRHQEIEMPGCVVGALRQLGLDRAVGYIRLVRIIKGGDEGGGAPATAEGGGQGAAAAAAAAEAEAAAPWLPLAVQLGVPLYDLRLCRDVCGAAVAADFLDLASREAHAAASQALQAQLWQLVAQYGAPGGGWGAPGAPWAAAGRLAGGGGVRGLQSATVELGELSSFAELPAGNLLFDGNGITGPLDLGEVLQAVPCFSA